VPRISSFYGIVITMYHDEGHHGGRPHFHAAYGEDEASFDIETLALIVGDLPARARRLVLDWAGVHRDELFANWKRAREHQPLQKVDPLP
jgi:Domain of unknown function (DUF4160)